jgi:hypothetical protein
MTESYSAARISPDGEYLAWYRPASDDDQWPWLVISEDPHMAGVDHTWTASSAVAEWIPLVDLAVVHAGQAHQETVDPVIEAADTEVVDPVPTGMAQRVITALADQDGGGDR